MFSIIIPNYNHARFLKKRIDTILNQTYKDFEVIILDDYSTDNSVDIINQYNDDRIIYKVLNERNSGSPFVQWKKGLELSKYDYVWIAESDDYNDLSFLEIVYKSINEVKDISIFFCESYLVDENENFYASNTKSYCAEFNTNLWNRDHIEKGEKYFINYLQYKNFILNASSVVFKKELGLKYIDKILNFKTSGDWLFWGLIMREGNVYFSSQKLNYFRQSSQSTRNYNTLQKRQRRIIEKAEVISAFFDYYEFSNRDKKDKQKEIIKEWIKHHSFKEILLEKSFLSLAEISFIGLSKMKLLITAIILKIINKCQKN